MSYLQLDEDITDKANELLYAYKSETSAGMPHSLEGRSIIADDAIRDILTLSQMTFNGNPVLSINLQGAQWLFIYEQSL